MKATDRHITCIDCGKEFVGHYNKKRCSSCCKEHSRKKQREYALKYYYQDREAHLIRHREWLRKNKEHCAMYSVEYRKKRAKENPNWRKEMPSQHPDRVRAWSKKYYEEHKEDYARRDKESRQRNPERGAIRASKRRALRASAVLPTTDYNLINKMFKRSVVMSERDGVKYDVDHIIPLSKGGAHHQDNLRIVKASENKRKSASIIPALGGVWADNDLAKQTKLELGI
tara:strand:+ start:1266 stop:1949 length:684 start_codon:yes stop_codon:yes gene_type:complete